jgi:hypothetical protein
MVPLSAQQFPTQVLQNADKGAVQRAKRITVGSI